MAIQFQPPDPLYPTWGQSIGGGLDRFVQNYALAREQKVKEDLLRKQIEDDAARREAEIANFQATQGTFLTPSGFAGANAQISSNGMGAPLKSSILEEVDRIRQQGRNIQSAKATTQFYDPITGSFTQVAPGTRSISSGKPKTAKQAYVDEIFSRYQSDPSLVTDEEKQIAGITSKRTIISAETAKLIENANSGLRALDQMESAIDADPNVYRFAQPGALGRVGALTKGTEGQNYRTAAKTAMDIITRLRTGAALNANEEVFYQGLIPSVEDTPESARNKIKQLRDFYSGVVTRLQTGSSQGGGGVPGMIRLKSGKLYDPKTGKVQ